MFIESHCEFCSCFFEVWLLIYIIFTIFYASYLLCFLYASLFFLSCLHLDCLFVRLKYIYQQLIVIHLRIALKIWTSMNIQSVRLINTFWIIQGLCIKNTNISVLLLLCCKVISDFATPWLHARLPVLCYLLSLQSTHVYWVGDVI